MDGLVKTFIKELVVGSFGGDVSLPTGKEKAFLHASAACLSPEALLDSRLIQAARVIGREACYEMQNESIEFVKTLESLYPPSRIFRFSIIRIYEAIREASFVLEQVACGADPEKISIHPSLWTDPRGSFYVAVAETLYKDKLVNSGEADKKSSRLKHLTSKYAGLKSALRLLLRCIYKLRWIARGSRPAILVCGSWGQHKHTIGEILKNKYYDVYYLNEHLPAASKSLFFNARFQWVQIPGLEARIERTGPCQSVLDEGVAEQLLPWFMGNRALVRVFEEHLSALMLSSQRGMSRLNRIYETLFKTSRVGCVLVDEDQTPPKRLLVDSANQINIPTIAVCHAIQVAPANYFFSTQHVLVYGSKIAEKIRAYSGPSCCVEETGMPRLDALKRSDFQAARRKVSASLGCPLKRKWILIAMGNMSKNPFFSVSYFQLDKQRVIIQGIRQLARLASERGDIQLLIKFKNGTQNIQRLARDWGIPDLSCITLAANHSIDDLVAASDMIVHAYSTVGYEGAVAGKPVLRFRGSVPYLYWEFEESDIEKPVDPECFDEVAFWTQNLLFDQELMAQNRIKSQSYLMKYHPRENLGSAGRVYDYLSRVSQRNV